ncbi:MAG: hypothetical protein KDM81_05385, partial [Verrucomicrobiae bacterium]|nr:hypothetical protein [Verrucomicrobiae bacterium]
RLSHFLVTLILGLGISLATGAELRIDLLGSPPGQIPKGFRSTLAGQGRPGDWQVVLTDAPGALEPFTPQARAPQRPAVAQLSREVGSERFPLLVYDEQVFTDFTVRTRIKMVEGEDEQMAGVAFRLADEKNFYVVRASAKGNTLRFYRVQDGQRSQPVGVDLDVSAGAWHELEVECVGNRIRVRFDGKQSIPDLTDNTFREGKFALWTMSDSISQFADIRLNYIPRTTLAEDLVADGIQRYDRLISLAICSTTSTRKDLHVVASSEADRVGEPAGEMAGKVLAENVPYVAKRSGNVVAMLPLHDRNGDPIAAVRVEMKSFPGQTDKNAFVRAAPIVKRMQARVLSLEELTR